MLALRSQSFLISDTQLECFLRGAKFLAKNLRGLKIIRKILRGVKIFPSEKNRGCETIRGAKFSRAREKRGIWVTWIWLRPRSAIRQGQVGSDFLHSKFYKVMTHANFLRHFCEYLGGDKGFENLDENKGYEKIKWK